MSHRIYLDFPRYRVQPGAAQGNQVPKNPERFTCLIDFCSCGADPQRRIPTCSNFGHRGRVGVMPTLLLGTNQ